MSTPKQVLEYALLGNKSMEDAALNGVVANNMDKDFVRRIKQGTETTSNNHKNMDGSRSTHLMRSGGGYVYPGITQKNGKFSRNSPIKTGDEVNMGSEEAAGWFANNYKRTNQDKFK